MSAMKKAPTSSEERLMLRAVVGVIAVASVVGVSAQPQKPDNVAILKQCHAFANAGQRAEYAGCFAENATNHEGLESVTHRPRTPRVSR
jgi:hypothetical protein